MQIQRVPYDHPDVTGLVARVQEFYVERYGGPDDDPIEGFGFYAGAPLNVCLGKRLGLG